jgi:hypothetical protein
MPLARMLRNGVIAGVLGAGAVALWFLVVDGTRGRPFETPALLAAAILHGQLAGNVPILWSYVVEYTALHFAAFVCFGVAAAFLIVAAEREVGLVAALVVFFAAFEVFFVALVTVLGPAVSSTIAWWTVLVGNVLASAVMLGYFFLRHRALGRGLLGPWTTILREGVVAGLIGAGTVAVWFLAYDLAVGRPLHTPALLGAALLQGIRDPTSMRVTTNVVIGYTVLHGAAFVAFGILAAVLLAVTEREPLLLFGVFMLFTCFEVFFFGVVMAMDEALVESLGWWTILVGNLLATATMLVYFLARHRGLHRRSAAEWH